MKKIIYIIAFLILISENAFSIDTVSTKYFPLKAGNSWTYNFVQTVPPVTYRTKNTIIASLMRNGHLYYIMKVATTTGNQNDTIRIDSLYGRLLKGGAGCIWNPNDVLVDSLSSHKNDTFYLNCTNPTKMICTDDTSHFTSFGLYKIKKIFSGGTTETVYSVQYVKDIGMSLRTFSSAWSSITYTIVGCIIDGVMYGDTSLLTGINKITNEIPQAFQLFQNYPNPFNPVTKINYDLKTNSDVNITVFDITGKEVALLVNKKQNAGTYEVTFDGTNLPSGIYFYSIKAGEYSQTRKMVLLK